MILVAPRAGAWIETLNAARKFLSHTVAPRAGAWIETLRNRVPYFRQTSPLVQGRGLKLHVGLELRMTCVAPRAGAWIETGITRSLGAADAVAPRAGAWIETR